MCLVVTVNRFRKLLRKKGKVVKEWSPCAGFTEEVGKHWKEPREGATTSR
jgi:hypothetical protein